MKRIVLILAFVVVASAAWFAFPPAVHVWSVSDLSTKQERTFSDWFHSFSSGLLAVRIVGSLTESARLDTPLGPIALPKGDFDFITYASEAWSSSAIIQYLPPDGTKGSLTISVCLGSRPSWIHRPPSSALPVLYTGGWTAYHQGTEKKAWTGGFHHGVKWGEFTFWDRDGNVTHSEVWENGNKKG